MPFWFEVALAASRASDQGLWGAFARFHCCSNDIIGGRGRLRRPEIVLQQEQTSVINTVDTGDNIFPRCRWYRSEITKKPKFIAGVNDTAEKLFTGVNNTADKLFGGVSDTGNERVLPILACLHLKKKNKQNFNL